MLAVMARLAGGDRGGTDQGDRCGRGNGEVTHPILLLGR
jgi:hypothetical protein